jgi:hypothetical protein
VCALCWPCLALQVSEEYAAALSEQLAEVQAEVVALKEGSADAVSKAKGLEVAKRQGEVFQGELLANIEKAAASSKTFIAGMRTKHTAEKKALQDQIDDLKAQIKIAKVEALENKAAFEALALEEARWSVERQELLERSVSLDQTERYFPRHFAGVGVCRQTLTVCCATTAACLSFLSSYLSETTEHISYLKSKIEFLQESLEDAKQSLEPFVQKGLVPAVRMVQINPAVKDLSGRLVVNIPVVITAEDENGSYSA